MNVMRGTFRLSLFVGLAVTAYYVWQAFAKSSERYRKDFERWSTLRCAKHLLDKDTKQIENDYGNIDIGKLGCIDRKFWANKHEIQEAWAASGPDYAISKGMFESDLHQAWVPGLMALIVTNLLGFAFLGMRRAYRWVAAGFGQT